MSEGARQEEGRLGFADTVMRLFRRKEAAPAAEPETAAGSMKLQGELDAAIRELDQKIEERRRATTTRVAVAEGRATAEQRADASQRRMETAHQAIRADVEAMHQKLGTGFASADLDHVATVLHELAALTAPGKDSHELLSRARFAIGERLRTEAGERAVERLVELLRKQNMEWPDPTRYRPGAAPEEIERSRTRRLRDVREAFLAQDFERAAHCVLGVVPGWKSDYPERGTPLWEETVLEAVAAAIRGRIAEEFAEVLRRDRDALFARVDESIGKQLGAIQSVLAGGVESIAQANQAVASSLRAIDEIVTEIAWEHVQKAVPPMQSGA